MLPQLALALLVGASHAGFASEADHREFEATLHAPYTAAAGQDGRTFTLSFNYPFALQAQDVIWRLELFDSAGRLVQRWQGAERLFQKAVEVKVNWSGRAGDPALRDGVYQARMVALAQPASTQRRAAPPSEDEIDRLFGLNRGDGEERIEQAWDIVVGPPEAQAVPAFRGLATRAPVAAAAPAITSTTAGVATDGAVRAAVAATGSLPYTVYYGNLHSQTNHSDGGGALASCTGAQNPQAGMYGPTDAFTYAMNKSLDFLVASEHNHMYDGSDATNASASPATAKSLYQSGLKAASDFNAAHPSFLAVYGLEWGVISNGGHMNIFNTSELLEWEYNSSNQLVGDTYTAKSDYAALYTLMKNRGWIGQFNHPDTTGQFLVNGVPLGYTADGDQAMVLCEVLNTSAFSNNTTETETSRSTYEGACKKALEAGFHIAFSTDQDNHCANWGASYTNRTGVLIPNGTTLSNASFIAALKARRVFATMDKQSQLVLTANGHLMGERFTNSGTLNLVANFANSAGKTVSSVIVYEGVPGRNGTVTQLSTTANTTITPANGEHFYYAKVTQSDGNILWSAPVWVTQATGTSDTTPPTVSASESGTSGTITLSANASDNVGVTLAEFYVDGVLKASSNVAPYSATLNSTTLANGSHTLTAKAYDAANNAGTSSAVAFSISNTSTSSQLIANPGFESGAVSWTATSGVISNDATQAAHAGSYKAWLDGYGASTTDSLYQQVAISSTATSASLVFWLKVVSDETTTTSAYDTLKVQVRNSSGTVLSTLATYSNLNKGASYLQKTFDLTSYKGQTVRIYFEGVEDSMLATSFLVDDVTLTVK
jgi:hypothetical protein